ncbi:hypothetical protein A2422_00615 [Candidatus Woesebacteria bacterium RIFOXYC1_FULL_31_51]|uniref:Uncharacterized protein n=1 Tax=Candidatus Woesebacteria bacterium GW2011_GWC2_31_9 TaxID=1618586 RepID=A0A0F9YKB2_9BACT|nr:MAG: hypothetical protein UR17_C0001G0358 [Candidatus Woesebacteria bacterium GW2011_GWF1_31_35]KKP23151.1 MAG: hypothetical protein UR11_C0001G0125 [Candidatus Woesebacteria bacterium GW2011_GWC1_30_29]KKP26839.1 MAG: hypothetical protein UR13_C0002G0074 [Candidatus Woesebacteria bacterium GW2011_GWD1_31_12]KKP27414.1 MAG: hypothetical protein UR16_C0003G0074 [Candidatus Woesebacteria bacterium GW2011_GWB1_31_29]KKP31703.1 MAG: hypothetical protein UR21_C0006G0018 [Candidatus Woesebacteria 
MSKNSSGDKKFLIILLSILVLLSTLVALFFVYPKNKIVKILPTNKPKVSSYSCPEGGWIDCMPTIETVKNDCSKEAMNWYKLNYPDFKGGAY